MHKFVTWLGLGVLALAAYSYGAKAGRGRYLEIKAAVDAVRHDPQVRKARNRALKRAHKAVASATKHAKQIGR
ncbi:hypothetical protein [Gryllotalpicola protaetiae]|uniref:YtxH domain-containing protein n=1 Tax=Gryllotalpicola protaetiae TaxID=2419771 RepID=A0A387BXQ3_9MICO|nr:hypothetical protein [Gryllotalpicola protaetiae]AYG03131.1 hypothetical protein D7I44_06040 [Gryllotalpicola protaetiae]